MKKSVLFLLCCLLWMINAQAQHPIGIWKEGVTTIVNEMDSIVFTGKEPTSPEAVGIWKGGVPSIISGLDSIVFNRDYLLYPEGLDLGVVNEPTEAEIFLQKLSSDEENVEAAVLSHEDSVKYNAIAEEVLAMFAADDESRLMLARRADKAGEEYADEAMRKRGNNIFAEEGILIDNHRWNSGTWGPTFYGDFYTYYTTFRENGRRYLFVVFYEFGGFKHNRRAFLKLGQVNNGKVVGDLGATDNQDGSGKYVKIKKGQKYAYQRVCIDDFISDTKDGRAGCASFFPLIITENGGQRDYSNPIYVHTNPLMNGFSTVGKEWAHQPNGFIFGTVNNVPVYCNTSSNKDGTINWNKHAGNHQCVEFPQNYLEDFYGMRPTGDAINWPNFRAGNKGVNANFTVYDNDGTERVREGDLVVWTSAPGHIGVVIHCEKDTVWVAHQNGGESFRGYAIGTMLSIDKSSKLRDINPYTNNSSIHASEHPVVFIRVNINEGAAPVIDPEPEPEPVKAMNCDATSLDFGEIAVGEEKKLIFNVTNTGEGSLTFSPMVLENGSNGGFTVSSGSQTLTPGMGQGYVVTFKPTKEGTFTGKITIRTDAANHPEWTITLTGKAKAAEQWGEKRMVFSCAFENTQFNLYKQPNMAQYRTNAAGTKFYQSRLILDVTYQGKTGSSIVTSDVYLDISNNYQLGMAFDEGGWGVVAIFASSKAEGVNNLMDGYGFMAPYFTRSSSPIIFDGSGNEIIFTNENNWGWYPSFFYDSNGIMGVRHLSLSDNYEYESTRYNWGWNHFPCIKYSKSTYENMWKGMGHPQFLERPEVMW